MLHNLKKKPATLSLLRIFLHWRVVEADRLEWGVRLPEHRFLPRRQLGQMTINTNTKQKVKIWNRPVSAGRRNEAEPAISWNSSFLVRCTWVTRWGEVHPGERKVFWISKVLGGNLCKLHFYTLGTKWFRPTISPILATSPPDSFMPIIFGWEDNLWQN